MSPELTQLLGEETKLAQPARRVLSQDGTARPAPYLTDNTSAAQSFEEYAAQTDSLFGSSKAYQAVLHEKPEHRRMLWFRLQGYNIKETATLTGYTPQHVSTICKQPWFQEAFCKISTEMGKDAVDAFLEGEIVPTLQKLVDLRDNAESDAVRKSACDAILDRVRGKPTAKVEVKHGGKIDNVVYDVAQLMEEQRRNEEILRSRGFGTGNN